MSLFKRLFSCSQGTHEPDLGRLVILPRENTPDPAHAYFICRHCKRRFSSHVPGNLPPMVPRASTSAEDIAAAIPASDKAELAKLDWWRAAWVKPPQIPMHGGPLDPTIPLPLPPGPWRCPATAVGDHFRAPGVKMEVVYADDAPTGTPDRDRELRDGIARTDVLLVELRQAAEAWGDRQQLKDRVFSSMAEMVAQLGTCCRLKVGCVLLTAEGRVAGVGYNGAGAGMPHCESDHCNETCRCIRTVHAEENALHACSGAPHTAYVTAEPCLACTKSLLMAGVRRVVYLKPYTSIAEAERTARQEWIDHYQVRWTQAQHLHS